MRAADETVTYLLVAVDRNGADLTWAAGGTVRTEGGPETESVDGGHDDVHKTREGGLDRRSQTRAEDSWGRNAEAVAAVLDKRVGERGPDLVLITGDVRAVALVREAVGQPTRELLVDVPGGGRGEGLKKGSFEAHVAEALATFRKRRSDAVLEPVPGGAGTRWRGGHGAGRRDRGAPARSGGRARAARRLPDVRARGPHAVGRSGAAPGGDERR